MSATKQTQSLAFRQARTVFVISVTLGLLFSAYIMLTDIHTEKQRLLELYEYKLQQHYPNASQAAYHLNQLQAQQIAAGLLKDPAIYQVTIIDDFGDVLAFDEKPIALQSELALALADVLIPRSPVFETVLHQPNSDTVVGSFSFKVDNTKLTADFLKRISQFFIFEVFRDALMAVILLVVFYYKLSKPLDSLISWVRSLQDNNQLTEPPEIKQEDEIGKLAKTFHTLWREREEAEEKLQQLAYYDTLTGLANRSKLLNELGKHINEAQFSDEHGALFYLDLDRFKTINDSLGHTIGDRMLSAVSKRLLNWSEGKHLVARVGGDEFALLMKVTAHAQVNEWAKQINMLFNKPFFIDGHQLFCTVSIGIAEFPNSGDNHIDVLRQADTALYRAKSVGKNNFKLYKPEMQAQIESFLEVEKGLHRALKNGEFELYFQPQVNQSNRIVGAEALIRWNHPEKGVMPPGYFMPIAEETGQILAIGNWVLEQSCYHVAKWKAQGMLPSTFKRLALNISPLQFSQKNFVDQVKSALDNASVHGELLELELTESLLLENVENAIDTMHQLKELGLRLSIDDFGTGYSSLKYLKHLNVDELKIDRSFVTELHLDQNDQAIVDTIIMIAKRLNLDVIAEGVEDQSELRTLLDLGCHRFQGYLFDMPLKEATLLKRFSKNLYQLDNVIALQQERSSSSTD